MLLKSRRIKGAVTKARVLFSSLFSLLGVFVKGTVVSSAYLYILFRKLLRKRDAVVIERADYEAY